MDILAARVRSLRESKDWTQEDLAHESGLKRPHISLIETQERVPGADTLIKLATALGVSIDYLLGLSDSLISHIAPEEFNDLTHDPIFARWLECYLAMSPEARRSMVDVLERVAGLPPTRPFESRPLDKD
jgi:transcriptional regulator with XRE-family HTH domain